MCGVVTHFRRDEDGCMKPDVRASPEPEAIQVKNQQLGERLESQCSRKLPLRMIARRLYSENAFSRWLGTLMGRWIVGGFRTGVCHWWGVGGSDPAG